jgi:predicted CopG family antitoxin
MSKVISIRLENDLHKELKRQMVDEETSFQEYVLELIKRDREGKRVK